jgi:hypothetical protein
MNCLNARKINGVVARGLLLLAAFCLSAQTAQAAPGQWLPSPQKIQNIVVEDYGDTGQGTLIMQGGLPADYVPEGCRGAWLVTLDLASAKGRAQLATALLAQASDRPINLAFSKCRDGRPVASHLML